MAGLSRRELLAGVTAAGGAAAASPASAAPQTPALRPGPHAPVRALHADTMAYWDYTGAAEPAQAVKAKPQPKLEDLTPEQRWLMGIG